MALSEDLPLYRDTYRLLNNLLLLSQEFPRFFRYSMGFSMPMMKGWVPRRVQPWLYVLTALCFQFSGGVCLGALDGIRGTANFENCSALTTLTIPASVTEVGSGLLDGCSNLKTLYCHSEIPPHCDGKLAFLICENVVLYVPVGTKVAYESAECWRNSKEIVETDFLDVITQVEDPDTDVFVVVENGAVSVCNAAASDS